jgi:hypothetical protein
MAFGFFELVIAALYAPARLCLNSDYTSPCYRANAESELLDTTCLQPSGEQAHGPAEHI